MSPLVRTLVLTVAAIGFLFDTYELLMFPVIGSDAIAELQFRKSYTALSPSEQGFVRDWAGRMLWISALSGGVFGMLGGWMIDRFGRKTVMAGSIIVYSFSPVCAAFSSEFWMLVLFRSTTFIGVCVQMVAAVTWLAELFAEKRSRELAIGWTLATASLGGILVTEAYNAIVAAARTPGSLPNLSFPSGHLPDNVAWRFTLLTGLIPGALILFMLPFVPESRLWAEKKRAGTLRRPRFRELFAPELRRTTIVTTVLSACGYAAAFGALQMTPLQIVPGLPDMAELQREVKALEERQKATPADNPEGAALQDELKAKRKAAADAVKARRGNIQRWQELGGLTGRIILAILLIILPSRLLLRLFLLPGVILFPLTYANLVTGPYVVFATAIFFCGLLTVAQFSYLSEFLPKVFPLHLRGTGGSFATNVGGRMIGTMAATVNTELLSPLFSGPNPIKVAMAAAVIGGTVYLVALIASIWLPEPKVEPHEPQAPPPSSPLSTGDAGTAADTGDRGSR
ncbi:MAG TPA: MFS transporter [Gemmataceae bacterium]|nr:MFS transporter [Gemmataceae bacterium]